MVLTGRIGIGKTTLLNELFPSPLPGITTWAEPYQSVFMKDNATGDQVQIARYDPSIQGTKAKMVLLGDIMADFGCPILKRCREGDSQWVCIDEIGFLEQSCEPFQEEIRQLFDRKQVAAVIRKQDLPFLNELRSREDVFLVDLDMPFGNCGCVIMASGLGKRFGGNKLMTDFLGKPMISHILDVTDDLFAKRVVVTRHADVAKLCQNRGIPVVLHDFPYRSDTVRLGLEEMADVAHCLFCPGDQPLLRKDTIASLLISAVNNPDSIWRPCCDGVPGSPVLFPRWAFEKLRSLPEGKGGGWVVKNHPERCRMLSVSDSRELMDVDTPDILEQLSRSLL